MIILLEENTKMVRLLNYLKRNFAGHEKNLRKFQTDLAIPPAILLSTFYFSTFGLPFTILFLCILLPLSFYVLNIFIYRGNKINSGFYVSWTVSTLVVLLYIFEFVVVPFLEITLWENYTLLTFVSISTAIILFIRFRNNLNANIDDRPNRTLFFNQWIAANISPEHFKLYVVSLISIICALAFGMYLNITTICHTTLRFEFLLVPDDCSEIYFDINLSLSFISAIYAAMLAITILYSLVKLLYKHGKLRHNYNIVSLSD